MISSWRTFDRRKIPSDLESRLFRRIQMIDDATTDQDLHVPPSNHFEKLAGKAKAGCPISRLLKTEITLDAKLV